MKIIMYGSEICPDCVLAKNLIEKQSQIELDYRNITESTTILKEFLNYRDYDEIFLPIKNAGKIGIPFFVLEDGKKTFDLSEWIEFDQAKIQREASSCSIDGKGNC